MNEINDVLAMAIAALEDFAPSVTDPDLHVRIRAVRRVLEELRLELDQLEK